MSRSLKKIKGIIGIFLIIIALGGVYLWEVYGRENLMYTEVVVAKTDIPENTELTVELLTKMKIDTTTFGGRYYLPTQGAKIVGKMTKVDITEGDLITPSIIEDPNLVLQKGEKVFKIPSSWVLSYPDTLRRGDTVFVYPFKQTGNNGSYDTKTSKYVDKLTVLYVKDSSAKEIKTGRNEDGSNVNRFEVKLNLKQLNNLKDWTAKGYRFIFTYN